MHIFLVYGGKSPEHDVSVNSAASFLRGVSFERHTVTLIYITQEGNWLRGPLLTYSEKLESEKQLKLSPLEDESTAYGAPFKGKAFSFDELKEPDSLVFPLLHGPNGEDGTVQGLLELLDVPYAGPGVVPCACGMDKIISQDLFSKARIPQTEYFPSRKKSGRKKLELYWISAKAN